MKRYNKGNRYMVFVGILLPILAFFISMNAVYAYFTASSTQDSSNATLGALKIRFTGETKMCLDSNTITATTQLLPGNTFEAKAEVENGEYQAYLIINFKLFVNNDAVIEEFYTFSGEDIVAITENADGTYSVDPYVIENDEKKSFELTYNFDFTQYDNSYQNATLTYQLKACAIQTSNLTDPQQALKVLMERFAI